MNAANELYILALSKRDSNREIAAEIGVSNQKFSHARTGRNGMPIQIIWGLCEIAGEDPKIWIPKIQAENSKSEESYRFWRKFIASTCVILSLGILPNFADAAGTYKDSASRLYIHYVQFFMTVCRLLKKSAFNLLSILRLVTRKEIETF